MNNIESIDNCERTCKLILRLSLSDVKTNPNNLGYSYVTKHVDIVRKLTLGEISICKKLFRDTINYERVRILAAVHKIEENKPSPGVIAEKGVLYFPPKPENPTNSHYFQNDFSNPDGNIRRKRLATLLFIHEMTHIWQRSIADFNLQPPRPITPAEIGRDAYYIPWEHEAPRHFSTYNNEQQAELVAGYYDITTFTNENHSIRRVKYLLEVIKPFLDNPADKRLLPVNATDRR